MLLSIIIVSYNTKQLTLQTLASIASCLKNSPLATKTDVFVVDNNSNDGSVEAVRALSSTMSNLTLIENNKNLGFGTANNQAVKKSQGKYLFFLNSDTVVQPHALETLVKVFETHPPREKEAALSSNHGNLDKVGILSASLLNPDHTSQAQGGNFPTLLSVASQFLFLDDLPFFGQFFPSTQHTGKTHRRLDQVEWVAGTAMMVRREVFEEIGGFDEGIFMYGEDVELCLRAAHHHWDSAIVPEAHIVHFGSASSTSQHAVLGEIRGYQYIWAKHKPHWQRPFLSLILKIGVFARLLLFGTMRKDHARAQVYKEALRIV